MGPVVSEVQWGKIQALIRKGIEEGATLVAGGGPPEGLTRGYFVKPTVFADVSNEMTIAREEIFGPVLVIIPYDDEEDAIRMANDTVYGLSGYVQSASLERARAWPHACAQAWSTSTARGPTSMRRSAATSSQAMAVNGASTASAISSKPRLSWATARPDLFNFASCWRFSGKC